MSTPHLEMFLIYKTNIIFLKVFKNSLNVFSLIKHNILSSACSEGGDGGQLIQFESVEELELISKFLMFSTQSLPLGNGWLTGGFTDPFNIYSSLSDFEKM